VKANGFVSPCGRFAVTRTNLGKWRLWEVADLGQTPCGVTVTGCKGRKPIGSFASMAAAIKATKATK